MITFTCSGCGKRHSARDMHAGKQGVCGCGAIMAVPSQTNGASRAEKDAADRRLAWIIGLWGGALGLVLAGAMIYALFIYEPWEQKNESHLLALVADAEVLVRANEYEAAELKYDLLFTLVGDRAPEREPLKTSLDAARVARAANYKNVAPIIAQRVEAARIRAEEKRKDEALLANENRREEAERARYARTLREPVPEATRRIAESRGARP